MGKQGDLGSENPTAHPDAITTKGRKCHLENLRRDWCGQVLS